MTKKTRRNYSKQYKAMAVSMHREKGYSKTDVARRLGIQRSMVERWQRQLFPEAAPDDNVSKEQGAADVPDEKDREIQRLRAENRRLLEEKAILKNVWTAAVMQTPTVDWREPATPMYSASICRRFASGQDGESRTPGPNSLEASIRAAFFTGLRACRTAGCRHLDQRLRSLGDVTSLMDAV